VPTFRVGKRNAATARDFVADEILLQTWNLACLTEFSYRPMR
jgi:hypothetical protein